MEGKTKEGPANRSVRIPLITAPQTILHEMCSSTEVAIKTPYVQYCRSREQCCCDSDNNAITSSQLNSYCRIIVNGWCGLLHIDEM